MHLQPGLLACGDARVARRVLRQGHRPRVQAEHWGAVGRRHGRRRHQWHCGWRDGQPRFATIICQRAPHMSNNFLQPAHRCCGGDLQGVKARSYPHSWLQRKAIRFTFLQVPHS